MRTEQTGKLGSVEVWKSGKTKNGFEENSKQYL